MPLMYGEEEKAFRRLQEEIIKHTSDLSIFAWTAQFHSIHGSQDHVYSSVLASSPDYFSWCKGMHLRISAQKNGLPVYNDRVRIDPRIIACRTQGERPGWRYVLPIHHYQLPRRDVGSLAIELRKIGEDQYLRKDPSKLIDSRGLTYFDCHGTHQLFFDPPVVHEVRVRHDVPPSYNGKEYIRKLRCGTMPFIFGPNVQPMGCYPESRYDHEDGLFFTTDEYDCSDWGILEVQARFESKLGPASGPLAINYTVCTTSWIGNIRSERRERRPSTNPCPEWRTTELPVKCACPWHQSNYCYGLLVR
jgi:hypothetical protein